MNIVKKENNSELYSSLFEDSTIEDAKKVMQNMFNDITPEQFEELKKQAMENVKEKQYKEYFTDNNLNDMYDRTIKLLNGENKDTYGFAPAEIQQLIKEIRTLKQLYNAELDENRKHKFVIRELKKYLNADDWTSVNGEIAVRLIKIELNKLMGENDETL